MSSKVTSIEEAARQKAKELPSTHLPLIWARDTHAMLDVPFVVKGVIGAGELTVVYGPPKSGKTFLATELGLCVSTGVEWFGRRVTDGLVIYIASEMGARVQRRVRAWIDNRLGDAADGDPPFVIVPCVVNLLDEMAVEKLVATTEVLVGERGSARLIIVDTLARSIVGGDENSAQDMGRAIAVADRIRDKFNAATLLVHHSGKDAAKGTRGSSALLGAADSYIRVDSDDAGNRVATIEWSRDGQAGMQYGFRLKSVNLGMDADGDEVSSCIVIAADIHSAQPRFIRRDVALDALREAILEHGEALPESSTIPPGKRGVTLDAWKTRWALRTGYDESNPDSIKTNFHKDKSALLKADVICISRPYVWINKTKAEASPAMIFG